MARKDQEPEDVSGEEWAAQVEDNPWPGDAVTEDDDNSVEDYEPKFDRLSTERRVLGHVTDDDHVGRGPRNTVDRLALELQEDPNTRYGGNVEQLQGYLDDLEEAGLIEQSDGVYTVTGDGQTELAN